MTWPLEALTPKENIVTIFTLEALAELTQELLNDPNLKHKNITEKAAIFGHASTVLSAQRYAATLESIGKTMISALEAQASVDLQNAERAPGQSWVQLVSDELETIQANVRLNSPIPNELEVIPDWTAEELYKRPCQPELLSLCVALRGAVVRLCWDGAAVVFAKLYELARLEIASLPTWSDRPDLAELHRRLEWALATIKAQESSQ